MSTSTAVAKTKCDPIDRTNVTVGQVECVLRQHLNTDATLESWDYEEIGKGKGFVSCMVRMRLAWSPGGEALPASVVVKIPDLAPLKDTFSTGATEGMKRVVEIMCNQVVHLHNNETAVYAMFESVAHCDRPVPMARWYGGARMTSVEHMDAFLIMEDLSGTTVSVDMGVGFDQAQTRSLVDALARLHAWCLNNEHVWRPAMAGADYEMVMGPTAESFVESFDGFITWVNEPEQARFFGEPICGRVSELRPGADIISRFAKLHREEGVLDVMVHGDFYANNILMRKGQGAQTATRDISAVVDWQTVHPGSPTEDLALLFLFTFNSNTAAEEVDATWQFYHDRLAHYLGDTPPPYSLEQLRRVHDRMYASLVCMMAPQMQQSLSAMHTGASMQSADPRKTHAKLMADLRGMLAHALHLKDKHGDQ